MADLASPMKVFNVKRTHFRPDGTFGTIDDEGQPFACTVELPWRDNKPFISCIPSGEYTCEMTRSMKHGLVYRILFVPNREDCLIHWGNIFIESEGCIIIGERFGILKEVTAVLGSKINPGEGYLEFMRRAMDFKQIKLIITNNEKGTL